MGDDVDGVGVLTSDGGFAVEAVGAVGVDGALVVVGAAEVGDGVGDFDAGCAEFEVFGGGDFGFGEFGAEFDGEFGGVFDALLVGGLFGFVGEDPAAAAGS